MRYYAVKERRNSKMKTAQRYFVLLLITAVMISPLLWMIRVAFLPIGASLEISSLLSQLFSVEAFNVLFADSAVIRAVINSLFIGAVVTLGNVVFCFMTGYALSRKRFPGGKTLFVFALLTMMIPTHILIVPLYLILSKAGMYDTYWALTLPFLVTPIGIFMVKQYLDAIPRALEEAAYADGAGEMRLLWSILAPVCRPILAVLAIQTFLVNWNSFLFPFILTSSDDMRTLPVTLALMQGYQSIDWQTLMAGSTLAVVPVLLVFAIFQRRIVSGITAGAIKQ
ncbi:carbohydrate ABC transporter permease [bacterium AH-315-F03]|nr:carbohydrate ABC transporter permease [bacterium AH-315-F03]